MSVVRDATGDSTLDMDPKTLTEGWYGINIHHSGGSSTHPAAEDKRVGLASAGCQVFRDKADWAEAMDICEARIPADGIFTYTLIEETST